MTRASILIAATLATTLAGCSAQPNEPSKDHSKTMPHAILHATKSSPSPITTDPKTQPNELGAVRWVRDFEAAQALAKAQRKPMFVLFTEVPGCSTVNQFATDVLKHPLVVEAIESEFIPVAIYNNIEGKDRETLNAFNEPTWNNPVVRLMTHDKQPLAPRFAGPYQVSSLTQTITQGLTALQRHTPEYLALVHQEASAHEKRLGAATFSMHCFWSGEVKLGAMDGVVHTSPGFAHGKEVVQVSFDPKRTSSHALATQFGSPALSQKTSMQPSPKDDKYQLQRSSLRFVPMTPMQATRVNAALGTKTSPYHVLSPRQIQLHQTIQEHPKHPWPKASHNQPLHASWDKVHAALRALRTNQIKT